MAEFQLVSPYQPTGDQPEAIRGIMRGLRAGDRFQTLQGVTGSGKTFTMANIIAQAGRPALVISHNKTLAAQLFSELRSFFPHNAVEYFISYYDYYQPEAYIPQTDTFIEKDAMVNKKIEQYRLAATNSLLSRNDVIVVASVSCIYGLGDPEDYNGLLIHLDVGGEMERERFLAHLVELQYQRNDIETAPGTFRVRGDIVDVFLPYREEGIRVEFFGDEITALHRFNPLTMDVTERLSRMIISPAKEFVMPHDKIKTAIGRIEDELVERLREFRDENKILQLQRLDQRTRYDMDMLRELGYCSGIENYSRHLGGREAGTPPPCLLDYFQQDFITFIDESHATLPQLRAMYNGDQARKRTLIEHGFRLPSAADNRPLAFHEFERKIGQVVFASATPGDYELQVSSQVVEQVIRPTGLLDPPVEVRPLAGQIDDVMEEIRRTSAHGSRTLVTTLTKRTAEDLTQYLSDAGLRVEYLHSDIEALERVDILARLRRGAFDCLVGINLLREGLDLPEVELVAVLDADKEGFLRSDTSLIQTAGRAARHVDGRVILYADVVTDSMKRMIETTERRREKQMAYNQEHGITPKGIQRAIGESLQEEEKAREFAVGMAAESQEIYDIEHVISELQEQMLEASKALEFERAAALRDEIRELQRSLEKTERKAAKEEKAAKAAKAAIAAKKAHPRAHRMHSRR